MILSHSVHFQIINSFILVCLFIIKLYRFTGAYPEIWIRGSVKGWGLVPSFSSPPLPVLSPSPSRSLSLPIPSPPLPLEVGPLNPARALRSAVSSPSGVWAGASAEIEFGTF